MVQMFSIGKTCESQVFCPFKMVCAMMRRYEGPRPRDAETNPQVFLARPQGTVLGSHRRVAGRIQRSQSHRRRARTAPEETRPAAVKPAYRNAMVLTPEMSNRLRQRRFLQATLSSSSTM